MASQISVPFTTVADSGLSEAFSPDQGPTATVVFKCAWDDHYQLVRDLCGTAQIITGAGTIAQILRTFPYAYPGSPNIYCRSIESIEPFGKPYLLNWLPAGRWLAKKQALVTARFEFPKFSSDGASDPSGKPYTQTSLELSGEVLVAPEGAFRFPDGTPVNSGLGIVVPQMALSIKRFMLPYLPIAEMWSILGGVNGAPLAIGAVQFPAASVLFLGGPSNVSLDTNGDVNQEVEYKFLARPFPWNSALSPKPGQGFQPLSDGFGNGPYRLVDFSILP